MYKRQVNKVEGRCSPSVALANNGAEESKGTPMLKEAHQLLKLDLEQVDATLVS